MAARRVSESKKAPAPPVESESNIVTPVGGVDFDSPEAPPLVDGRKTVNGKPVPEEFEHLIGHDMTDQGLWEKNHGKQKRRVEVREGPWEKKLQQRADMPWLGSDPFKEAVDAHREPGFTYRMLSKNVCDKRSLRGWEPVKDERGDIVKVNSMFLGRMPVELKEARNEHYRRQGNEALQAAQEQFQLNQEKHIRDAGGQGMSPLRRGEQLTDVDDPDRTATVGFEQFRGRAE